jgi:hypothetical protein
LKEEEAKEEDHPKEEQEEDEQKIPPKTPRRRLYKNHPLEQIIGNKYAGVKTLRRMYSLEQRHLALVFAVEPSSFEEANNDEHWIKAMDE